jgi:hypothetical protein
MTKLGSPADRGLATDILPAGKKKRKSEKHPKTHRGGQGGNAEKTKRQESDSAEGPEIAERNAK